MPLSCKENLSKNKNQYFYLLQFVCLYFHLLIKTYLNLNIDMYDKNELLSFFKLNQTYTNEELNNNELTITTKILNSDYDTQNKYEIITFIYHMSSLYE